MTEIPILTQKENHIVTITLNRPHRINAFNRAMYLQLNAAIEAFRDDDDAWVAIITGAGERGFSSGVDIKALAKETAAGVTEPSPDIAIGQEMVTSKPIIAAVHGHCVGEGVNLALACDMVIAEEGSNFFVSEARVGVNAVDIPLKLSQKMGYFAAFELLMGVEGKTAVWCQQHGLVNHVVPNGTAVSAAKAWATRLIDETAPLPIRAMKETLWTAVHDNPATARTTGLNWRNTIANSHDWHEGRTAFAQKRKPQFKGK